MAGYVYLIGSPTFGWYKIGMSGTPAIRLKAIGILLPFKIELIALWKVPNPAFMEAHLHTKYMEHQINGEWFRFDPDQLKPVLDEMSFAAVEAFADFTNLERDAPTGKALKIKLVDDLSVEERERRKTEAIAARSLREKCPTCGRTWQGRNIA